jgi:hypothetical protein
MTNRSRPGVTVAAAITGAVLVAVVGCSATHSPAPSPAGTSTSSPAGTSTSSPGGTSTSSSDAGSSTSAIAATCTTSSPQGQCPPYGSQVQGELYPGIVGTTGEITVGNNVFGPASNSYSQTLHVATPGNWTVVANFPVGTSVRSYPNTGQTQNWINGTGFPAALSSWSSMISYYSVSLNAHSGTVGEAAYDLWLDDWKNEVMIQTDFAGDSLRPRCDVLHDVITTQTFGGTDGVPVRRWNLCQFGSEIIWQPPTGTNYSSGKVNVMAMLTWLETHGGGKYLPAKPTLTAISFGFEICSTASRDQTFRVNDFSFTAKPA